MLERKERKPQQQKLMCVNNTTVASRNFANEFKNSMFYSNIACKWISEQAALFLCTLLNYWFYNGDRMCLLSGTD